MSQKKVKGSHLMPQKRGRNSPGKKQLPENKRRVQGPKAWGNPL